MSKSNTCAQERDTIDSIENPSVQEQSYYSK